jgi:tetratricopeptide (TPR) repeat protein
MAPSLRNALPIALVAAASLYGFAAAAGAIPQAKTHPAHRTETCPSPDTRIQNLAQAGQLLGQSNFPKAIALLAPLAPHHCDPRIALLLSGAYEGNGDIANAKSTLEDAHAMWPSDTSLATSLARLYLAGGQTDEAVRSLDGFHTTTSTPPQEMNEAALVFIAGHRLESAQAVANSFYRQYPSLSSLLLLANVLQLEGRYKDVNSMLKDKRAAYANEASFLITAAESEYDAMLYDAAKTDLEQAITLTPRIYQAHFLLGNVLMAKNMPDQAAAEYRSAIDLAPNQPRSFYQLALISRQQQDEAAEMKYLSLALSADDQYSPAYIELGRILIDQHEYSEAVTKLNLAAQYNPHAEQAYFLLSRAYASLGDRNKSTEMAKLYAKIREENRNSFVNTHAGQIGVTTKSH